MNSKYIYRCAELITNMQVSAKGDLIAQKWMRGEARVYLIIARVGLDKDLVK